MNKLDTVEVIENLAIQYLDELKVEHGGPVVIESYDEDEAGLSFTIVFDVDASFDRAAELCWNFTEIIVDRDLDAERIFVDFIGKENEEK